MVDRRLFEQKSTLDVEWQQLWVAYSRFDAVERMQPSDGYKKDVDTAVALVDSCCWLLLDAASTWPIAVDVRNRYCCVLVEKLDAYKQALL